MFLGTIADLQPRRADPRLVALADRVVHLPDRLSFTVTH
jgi:hypothetical protein